jgi:serine/threonine-protein kinase
MAPPPSSDERSRVLADFQVVGELGRDGAGAPVYLARDATTDQLVALKLPAVGADAASPEPVVFRSLGNGVPAAARPCPICRGSITDWRPFCPRCGSDVSGKELATPGPDPAADLAAMVRSQAAGALDVLGSMPREQGGGAVHFARHRNTGEIVALTLQRGGDPASSGGPLGLTMTSMRQTSTPLSDEQSRRSTTPSFGVAVATSGTPTPTGAVTDGDAAKVCPSCSHEFGAAVRFCPHDGTVLRAKDASEELIGAIVAERYHVVRKLGQGGMGQVYLAEHVKMGRRCALKVMHRALSEDVNAISRFGREAANASRINHTNVATIYDFGETTDRLIYLAMEYVEGDALSKLMRDGGSLAPARVIELGRQTADALVAAHGEGVIHRDLKPDNILVARQRDGSEVVKVVDFGIAKAMYGEADGLTRTGFVVGTPRYMSPEQLIAERVDARSDLYSLGCVLYEMLVGQPPFGDRPVDLSRRLTEPPPRARSRNSGVPAALDDVVARALARAPDDRFGSAAELRDALAQAAAAGAPSRAGWLSTLWPPQLRRARTRTEAAGTEQSRSRETGPRAAEPVTPPDGSGRSAPRTPASSTPAAQPPPSALPELPTRDTPTAPLSSPLREAVHPSHHAAASSAAAGVASVDIVSHTPAGIEPLRAEHRGRARRRWSGLIGAAALVLVAVGVTVPWSRFGPEAVTIGGPIDPILVVPPPVAPAVPPLDGTAVDRNTPTAVAPARPAAGALRLAGSLPPGARVAIDGGLIQVGGGAIALAPGSHRVVVTADGYERGEWTVTIRPDIEEVLSPTLRPLPATAASEPADPPQAAPADPLSFDEFARRDIERLRQALEARDFERARSVFRAPLPDWLVAELRPILSDPGAPRLTVAVRPLGFREPTADFHMSIVSADDPSRTLLWGGFSAHFQHRPDGSWLLMGITRH